ncbi:predicted protein [Streptomyces sp. SPB78]|nr:predicted protein [Streptomyces sp. SPB78]
MSGALASVRVLRTEASAHGRLTPRRARRARARHARRARHAPRARRAGFSPCRPRSARRPSASP